jgi:cytoskeletal protein RodZ
MSLDEASRATHIHGNILKKIESDDFSSLGTIYVKGFLKIYAEYLGLDKDDVVGRFVNTLPAGQQRPRVSQKVIIPAPAETGQHKIFSGPLTVVLSWVKKIDVRVVVIIALCLFVVWGFRAVGRALAHRRAQKPAADVRPGVSSPTSARKAAAPLKTKVAPAPATKAAAGARATTVAQKVVLVVRAKSKTWLQVKLDGKVVFQSTLARGAAESWTAEKKIEMMIGNAGALELELNGRILEKIGRPGQTLKHVVVTRDGLAIDK